MNAIVLAGGRGRRLGLLTESTQKAALCFNGNPLISHIIDSLQNEQVIERVSVLTGYRGNDIHDVLNSSYREEVGTGKIQVIDLPQINGTLSRLAEALKCFNLVTGCYVCGIDSLVPQHVFHNFCTFVGEHSEDVVLLFSPRLEVAPTHKIGCLQKDRLVDYPRLVEIDGKISEPDFLWYTDVEYDIFHLTFYKRYSKRASPTVCMYPHIYRSC